MTRVDALILGKLYDRPHWLKSLVPVRARVNVLADAGLVERVRPCPQGARNMVAITAAGRSVIEKHWEKAA